MHMHAYACVCMHMHVHLHMHVHVHMHMHMHASPCTHVHMHAYACTCMHMRAYAYDQAEKTSGNGQAENLQQNCYRDEPLDFGILQWPYNTFVRELWNSRDRLRPLMHQGR